MRGFQAKNLTPYLHVLLTHAPEYLAEFGPMRELSGERLENENGVVRKVYLRQTNCQNICDTIIIKKLNEQALRNEAIRVFEKRKQRPVETQSQVS